MRAILIPIGSKFNRLTVTGDVKYDLLRRRYYPCVCQCGTETTATTTELVMGRKRSCGCQKIERIPLSKRFWERIIRRGDNECWGWSGSCQEWGYGQLWDSDKNRNIGAHRVSYEIHFGPIPVGMFVCHHCDNPPCCNPKHLFLGTTQDNTADCVSKGRHHLPVNGQVNKAKTHCVHGHEFTPNNTYVYATKNGVGRSCRTCALLRGAIVNMKERNARLFLKENSAQRSVQATERSPSRSS